MPSPLTDEATGIADPDSGGSAALRPRRTARKMSPRRIVSVASATVAALTLAGLSITGNLPFTGSAPHKSTQSSNELAAPGTPTTPPSAASIAASPSASVSATHPKPGVVLDGRVMGGWYAGASGIGVSEGTFAKWLKQPVTISGTWADTESDVQALLPSLTDEYKDWDGALDIAVGGTVLGSNENYAKAAAGAYDKRWKQAAKILAAQRATASGPTFVRPFHEMNGGWYQNWTVTKANSAAYKKAFARYVAILRAAMPSVYIAWSPNYTDHTGLPVAAWYPGDDVVDVVAPDYYDDDWADGRLSVKAWNAESTKRDEVGNPAQAESWRQFALAHGKPLAFPEWGLKPEGGGVDHPEWIKAVNAWMNRNANSAAWQVGEEIPDAAAGKVLYSIYFNVEFEGSSAFTVHGLGANPRSAAVFPKLTWGKAPAPR